VGGGGGGGLDSELEAVIGTGNPLARLDFTLHKKTPGAYEKREILKAATPHTALKEHHLVYPAVVARQRHRGGERDKSA